MKNDNFRNFLKTKVGSKYTPKRTKVHQFKTIFRGSLPPNPPSNADGFYIIHSFLLCLMRTNFIDTVISKSAYIKSAFNIRCAFSTVCLLYSFPAIMKYLQVLFNLSMRSSLVSSRQT